MRRAIASAILIILVIASTDPVLAQSLPKKSIDSIMVIAYKAQPDSNSVKAFSELQRYYFNLGKYDSALLHALPSIPVAEKLGDKKRLGRIYYNLGLIYTNLTRYDSAKIFLDKGEELSLAIKDTAVQINCINASAMLCNYQSDFSGAVEHMLKAAKLIEGSDNSLFKNYLPQTYGNIGHNLIAEKQFAKGIDYEKKALLLKDYPDEQRYRVMIHLDIADAYISLKNTGSAKLHLDTAAALSIYLENKQVKSLLLNSQGNYFDAINDLPGSLRAYTQAYQMADSINNNYLKAQAAASIADLHLRLKNYPQAEKFALESNSIGKVLSNFKVVAGTYKTLRDLAVIKNDYKKALEFSDLRKLYADSATNDETQKATVYLEAKYQDEKKEKEISELQLSNAKKELAVTNRNKILLIGGIAAAALLFIIGLFYRSNNQKRMIAEKDRILQQEQIKFLERQQQIVSLQSMVNGQETERTRIAKDLHDGLGGLFSTVKMYLSTLQHQQKNLENDELFKKSFDMVDTASNEVRRIAHNMMPEVLLKMGLTNAVKDLCDNISAGRLLQVNLEVNGMDKRLNAATEIMLYRIIQELLNNIIKHASATVAIVQFIKDENRLSITVEDDGKGFNMAETTATAGIETVKSRVDYLNGNISIDSQKNIGTTVSMEFLLAD